MSADNVDTRQSVLLIFGRYVISGTAIFGINLLIAYLIFSVPLATQSNLSKNIANVITTELAYLAAFAIHSLWTWRHVQSNFWKQLVSFHVVSFLGFILRAIVFGVLVYFEFDWLLATLASIASVIVFNFIGYFSVVFVPRVEPYDGPSTLYEKEGPGLKALEITASSQNYNRYIAANIEKYIGDQNLEVGPGVGTLASLFRSRGNMVLCEASARLRADLKQRFQNEKNIQVHDGEFFSFKNESSIDCVYSVNMLEHVKDDLSVVDHALVLLRPGGHFVAWVPAGMWLYSKFDWLIGHYRRYSCVDKKRIGSHLKSKGNIGRLIAYRYKNLPGAFGWFVRMKATGIEEIQMRDIRIMDALIPYTAWIDNLPFPLGQSLLIVIQKDK